MRQNSAVTISVYFKGKEVTLYSICTPFGVSRVVCGRAPVFA